MQIREIMTESVVTAPPDARLQQVAALMRDRNVGSVVLVDDAGRPVGMVTDRDLDDRRARRGGIDRVDAGRASARPRPSSPASRTWTSRRPRR